MRLARENLKGDTDIQAVCVIVDDHREQARSHRFGGWLRDLWVRATTVGASARLRLARENLKGDTCIQAVHVIVDDHREQARSHRFGGWLRDLWAPVVGVRSGRAIYLFFPEFPASLSLFCVSPVIPGK